MLMDEPAPTESAEAERTAAPPDSKRGRVRHLPAWIALPLRWGWVGLRVFLQALLITWATLAIYWSNLPWRWARITMAIAFACFAIWALWVKPNTRTRWAFTGVFTAVVVWWICIPPSHDRPWRPDVAVMPRAEFLDGDDGDRVRLTGFRNFDYRARFDFDERWETRDIRISRIVALDWFISYWHLGPIAHTFVSFDFDDGTLPVCISIEARPEVGEGFAPLASNFKQFELIYVVGDERDIVRHRTTYRPEEVFLYHIRASPENVRKLFRIYLKRINQLADRPEWYHLLSNNCTLNVMHYGRTAGAWGDRFDHRFFFNGLIDRYLYGVGVIDTSLPFDELRRRSHINEAARAADDAADFSARIRASLPQPPPP